MRNIINKIIAVASSEPSNPKAPPLIKVLPLTDE
jgi:hypothetical protein